jgi:tRNA A-37 threonylcarbamoyl transferase component Bud32
MAGLEGLLAGRILVKRYRIGEVIGRGGMAAVYRAEDVRLGRPVAVKVITLPAPDPAVRQQLRERFQREARAAASLPHHPNVVSVHDFGTDPELDIDFLVMELLVGEDLATHLAARGRPPVEVAVAVLHDAAEGLAAGHRAGLVHRDVKPGNLFLAEPHASERFRVCVLDFGIARLAGGDDGSRLTRGGVPLSPGYASPEQLRGEMDLSPASDVFSLGAVGYQLLTGERPFPAERRRRSGEIEEVPPIRALNPAVPEAVEAVIRRAMAEHPGDRYPDAGAFASALASAVEGGGRSPAAFAPVAPAVVVPEAYDDRTMLQPPPVPERDPGERPRRRRAFPLALLGILLLAGLGIGGWWALGRSGGVVDTPLALPSPDSVSPPGGTDGEEQDPPPAEAEPAPRAPEESRPASAPREEERARPVVETPSSPLPGQGTPGGTAPLPPPPTPADPDPPLPVVERPERPEPRAPERRPEPRIPIGTPVPQHPEPPKPQPQTVPQPQPAKPPQTEPPPDTILIPSPVPLPMAPPPAGTFPGGTGG